MALATNLKGYWKMDESSGDATDSKNGNTAVNTSVTYGTGKKNNCAIYNGSAYHTIADNTNIKPTNAISISLWVNITSTSNYQMLLAKGENASDTRSYEIRCYGTTTQLEMQLRVGGGSYINFRSTTALTTGVWYHVVFTRTSTTNAIYINGVQETLAANTTNSGNIDYSTDALWFGQRNGGLRFNGKLDEIALFDVALSADEASQMFNSGRVNEYPLTDTPALYGCIACFNLDESSGAPQNSVSSYYHMTNVGTMPFGTAKINNGILPDGTNRMVAVQSQNLGFTKGSQNYTWNFWVKMASWTTYITQMTTTAGGGLNALTYGDSAGHMKLHVGGNEVTSGSLSTGTWYMVTIVKSGTTYELFIDNVSQGTVAEGSNAASYNTFALGCNTNDGGITVAGSPMPSGSSIDIAAVFNRSLTSTERGYLLNSGAARQYPFTLNVNYTQSVTDSVTISDAYSVVRGYAKTITENLTMGEALQKAITHIVGETATASDAVNGGKVTVGAVIDSITVSDVYSYLRGYSATVLDTITVGDTRIAAITKAIIESTTISEAIAYSRVYFKTVGDSFTLADAVITTSVRAVRVLESITVEETLGVLKNGVVVSLRFFAKYAANAISTAKKYFSNP